MINSKRLMRFYFKFEELERVLDNLILTWALRSAEGAKSGDYYAERIIDIIEAKRQLCELWQYIDSVMATLTSGDKQALQGYANMRCGVRKLDDEKRLAIKRAQIKFWRHARAIERFSDGVRIVGEYYCLI